MRTIIGLTGLRGVGKTTVADMLFDVGFYRVHPFDGGKVATKAYFRHLGASESVAHRMVYGDLKDVPSDVLPGKSTPRFFMEKFGRFLGVTLGREWTLGAELARAGGDVVVESLVYEQGVLKAHGGKVVRVTRDQIGPAGVETDAAQAEIEADYHLHNDGSMAQLRAKITALVEEIRG